MNKKMWLLLILIIIPVVFGVTISTNMVLEKGNKFIVDDCYRLYVNDKMEGSYSCRAVVTKIIDKTVLGYVRDSDNYEMHFIVYVPAKFPTDQTSYSYIADDEYAEISCKAQFIDGAFSDSYNQISCEKDFYLRRFDEKKSGLGLQLNEVANAIKERRGVNIVKYKDLEVGDYNSKGVLIEWE